MFLRKNITSKYYNHLGNVLLVSTDRKMGQDPGTDGTYDYYHAVITAYNDYGPFGNILDGRSYSGEAYRYGFQNQEKDNELYGDNNSVNFLFRMYDPRLGRFMKMDPLSHAFAYNSPYCFAENRVIDGIDLEGLEYFYAADGRAVITGPTITVEDAEKIGLYTYDKAMELKIMLKPLSESISIYAYKDELKEQERTEKNHKDFARLNNSVDKIGKTLKVVQTKVQPEKIIEDYKYRTENSSSTEHYINTNNGKTKPLYDYHGNYSENSYDVTYQKTRSHISSALSSGAKVCDALYVTSTIIEFVDNPTTENALAVGESALDIAADVAIATPNPYAKAAGYAYYAIKFTVQIMGFVKGKDVDCKNCEVDPAKGNAQDNTEVETPGVPSFRPSNVIILPDN